MIPLPNECFFKIFNNLCDCDYQNQNLLFEYTSNITSVASYHLFNGIEYWLNCFGYEAHDSHLEAITCSLIAMFIRTSKKLKYLSLTGNFFNKIVFKNISRNTTIISIYFHNIDPKTLEFLCEVLCTNTIITSLELSCIEISKKCGLLVETHYKNTLAKLLYMNNTLISLKISKTNYFNYEGFKVFVEALCVNNSLTFLNLSYNKLGPKEGKLLADALCKNTTLTSLNLECNNLGPEGGKALAKVLYMNNALTSLNIYGNQLGSEGCKALAKALCKNITLTSLNLSCNNIGPEGGKALAKVLYMDTALTSLNIYGNQLGSEGCKALAKALCKNITLTFLSLGNNGIDFEGGMALAETLCENNILTSLDVSFNRLGSEGGKALAKALHKNITLTSLDIGDNYFNDETEKVLDEVLYLNTTLTYLNYDTFDFGFF
ncbi:RNI-like protein [Gigaspora margarita]|uniref:RNI-like protein n=1 Tax=Gigaspora margarita TaxID=4874 RepID=A0A8H4A4Y7_GIGMA|nr:RNI-like protein [Gigaspora margarita]